MRISHNTISLFMTLTLVIGAMVCSCGWDGSDYVEIKNEPVKLTGEWTVLTPPTPIQASRRWQAILLEVRAPIVLDSDTWDLRFPDGTHANPEVELVAIDGTLHQLAMRHFLRSSRYNADMLVCDGPEFVSGQKFREVRIRSNRPVTVTRVVWHCSDPK